MSPFARTWATPSAIAVFPTPGSPIKHGLFFRRRPSVLRALRISWSRPNTVSSFPSTAICVKSTPTSFKVLVDPAADLLPPTTTVSFTTRSSPAPEMGVMGRAFTRSEQNWVTVNPPVSVLTFFSAGIVLRRSIVGTVSIFFPLSYPSNANNTCSDRTAPLGASSRSAIVQAFVNRIRASSEKGRGSFKLSSLNPGSGLRSSFLNVRVLIADISISS
mmetsp:Transcript_17585/g.40360  ORF Transcript_17585/g.40360 Transcript_17585/m.40360 type:complete len:217 (-) Transcript_17585:314-964(-)